jgi:hypothetical protein
MLLDTSVRIVVRRWDVKIDMTALLLDCKAVSISVPITLLFSVTLSQLQKFMKSDAMGR